MSFIPATTNRMPAVPRLNHPVNEDVSKLPAVTGKSTWLWVKPVTR